MAGKTDGIVLITGASSGLGKATALYLARKGYRVVGTSRDARRLASLEETAAAEKLALFGVQLDINDEDAVTSAVPGIVAEHGGVDALVNNAGYGHWGPGESFSDAELKAQFETNFFAAARLMRAVLPGMVKNEHGTIVNVSSVEGRLATPFSGAYAASKFALEGLSEAMRVELWPLGVRVAMVEPGLFPTQFFENQVIAERAEDENLPYRDMLARYRQKRLKYERDTDPDDVARVIHKIIRSRKPRFRYPVGIDARAGMLAARFLPERLFQALLSRATLR